MKSLKLIVDRIGVRDELLQHAVELKDSQDRERVVRRLIESLLKDKHFARSPFKPTDDLQRLVCKFPGERAVIRELLFHSFPTRRAGPGDKACEPRIRHGIVLTEASGRRLQFSGCCTLCQNL